MTLSDLECHSPTASFLKYDFSYCYAAVDKISTHMGRRAVPLQ